MDDTLAFERLIAGELADELSQEDRAALDRLCRADDRLAERRSRLRALFEAGASDDTEEAPGSAILRAHRIMADECSAPCAGPVRERSIVRIVFDSLLAAPALRGSSSDRRHLLLQSDVMTADVFIDEDDTGRRLSVLFEEPETPPESVCLVSEHGRSTCELNENRWAGPVDAGETRILVRFGDRLIESDPFEVV